MIDPVETVIACLLAEPDVTALVSTRIANKHRYGVSWTQGQAAITVRQQAGALSGPLHRIQVEIRCYGETQDEAMAVWLAVSGVAAGVDRRSIVTTQGTALLYFLIPRVVTQIWDEEVKMDAAMCAVDAMVSKEAIA